MKIAVVGLGLIGGSFCKAIKKYTTHTCLGVGRDLNSKSVQMALLTDSIDKAIVPEELGEADLSIICLHPQGIIDFIKDNQQYFRPGTLLTDVTGVKGCVVEEIQSMLRPDVEFIAAHPMAGREVSGVRNSTPAIFRDANYVVTPTPRNTEDAIELCCHLGRVLGFARVSVLSVENHDEVIAFVSQLTHCIAMCLMTCQKTEHLEDYTGDSFRDLTRIARLNDEMWSELFLSNKDALLSQMALFENELSVLRKKLEAGDREGLREMMRASTARRALFDKKPI